MMLPSSRFRRVAAALVAALALAASAARAQEGGCVGLEISPARLAKDQVSELAWTVGFRNCDASAYDVRVSVKALGHDLDGTPQFYDSGLAEAALTLEGETTFTIQPGKQHQLAAEARIPAGKRSLYAGIVAEFEPAGGQPTRTVDVRTRVAGMLLQRGPKPWKQTASVVDVGLEQREGGGYAVYAAIKGTGNVHINPTGTMEIRKDGTLLDTVALDGGTILPGFKRRLVGTWTPKEPPDGKVKLTAVIQNPTGRGSKTLEFTDGLAPAPAGRLVSLLASDDDGAALVEATLVNAGGVDLTPVIELTASEGEFQRAREVVPFDRALPPGAQRTVRWRPDLPDGTYEIKARATHGDVLLDERVTGLRLGVAALDAPAESSRWLILLLAAILLVLVVSALMFVLARRRRRHDDDDQGRAAPVEQLSSRPEPAPLTRTAAR